MEQVDGKQPGHHPQRGQANVEGRPNVWMITLNLASHVRGFLQFGKLLASQGLTVTLFTTDGEIRRLHASDNGMLGTWEREGLDIRLETLETPDFVYGDGSFELEHATKLIRDTEDAFEAIVKRSSESGSKPTCLFSDVWLPRTREVASQYGIPACVYSLFSASYVSAVVYISQLESAGIFKLPSSPGDKQSQDEVISLPGLSLMRISEVPSDYFRDDIMYKYASRHGPSIQKSRMIVFSTCKGMETRAFSELEKLLKASAQKNSTEEPRIFTVGPTFLRNSSGLGYEAKEIGEGDKHPSLKFLDSQPANSVLFVAFGTIVSHTKEQMCEIAIGLQNSQQPFVCVLNPPLKIGGPEIDDFLAVIPSDCIAETKGRGLFLKCAPQMEILSHPSTGGFLSHCGQNSTLESMYMGVPLLGWPLFSDQSINCRFLVDEAQVALEICRRAGQLVDRKEVERGVRALLQGDEGKVARKKALEMKELLREAVGENGSSRRDLDTFAALIKGF